MSLTTGELAILEEVKTLFSALSDKERDFMGKGFGMKKTFYRNPFSATMGTFTQMAQWVRENANSNASLKTFNFPADLQEKIKEAAVYDTDKDKDDPSNAHCIEFLDAVRNAMITPVKKVEAIKVEKTVVSLTKEVQGVFNKHGSDSAAYRSALVALREENDKKINLSLDKTIQGKIINIILPLAPNGFQDLKVTNPTIATVSAAIDKKLDELNKICKTEDDHLKSIKELNDSIKGLDLKIKKYQIAFFSESEYSGLLKKSRDEIDVLNSRITSLNASKLPTTTATAHLKEVEKLKDEIRILENGIEENIKYRKLKDRIDPDKINAAISALEENKKIHQADINNKEEERKKNLKEIAIFESAKAELSGPRKAIDKIDAEIGAELNKLDAALASKPAASGSASSSSSSTSSSADFEHYKKLILKLNNRKLYDSTDLLALTQHFFPTDNPSSPEYRENCLLVADDAKCRDKLELIFKIALGIKIEDQNELIEAKKLELVARNFDKTNPQNFLTKVLGEDPVQKCKDYEARLVKEGEDKKAMEAALKAAENADVAVIAAEKKRVEDEAKKLLEAVNASLSITPGSSSSASSSSSPTTVVGSSDLVNLELATRLIKVKQDVEKKEEEMRKKEEEMRKKEEEMRKELLLSKAAGSSGAGVVTDTAAYQQQLAAKRDKRNKN